LKFPVLLLLYCLIAASLWAQPKTGFTVSGLVKDSTGAPIPNATISEKGAKNAVTTNNDGAFTIKVSSESSILIISSVGFANQEIVIGSQSYLSVMLQ